MTNDETKWTMKGSGIANVDPRVVPRWLCKHYLVTVSKANRDQLVEFCHLVVLLDLKSRSIPQDLGDLVDSVMKDPQPKEVQEAVRKLHEFADSLDPDPREGSSDVANAWRRTKKIKEGKDVVKLDEKLLSQSSSSPPFQSSSSINPSKSQIPIQVQVWPQTQGKLDKPASEIRCAVPTLSMVGNLQNIIRYAATAGFNFPLRDGKPLSKSEKVKLHSHAMLFSRSSEWPWVLRDESTRLGQVIEHSQRLQIVNTRLKTLALAVVVVVVKSRQKFSEPFPFDLNKPYDLVDAVRDFAAKPHVLRYFPANDSLTQTRCLTILPEEAPLPHATANHDHKGDPHTRHSTAAPSPGTPPSSSSKSDSRPAAPPVVQPQRWPPASSQKEVPLAPATANRDHRRDPHTGHSTAAPSPGTPSSSSYKSDSRPAASPVVQPQPQPPASSQKEVPLAPATANSNPNVHPIRSSAKPSPGVPPSSSPEVHRPVPPLAHPQVQPASAKAHQPEIVDAQAPADHRDGSLRSSSSSASFHTVGSKYPEPTQVHHDSKTGHPAHGTPNAPSINSMSGVPASSSSSMVVVDPPAQSAIPSKPPKQTPPTTDASAKKEGFTPSAPSTNPISAVAHSSSGSIVMVDQSVAQSDVPSKPPNQTPPTTDASAKKKGFTPSAPSTNPISAVTASSSSSMVMVDQSVAQSAILSKPPNQTPPTTDAPAKKKGSDSLYRRFMKKIGL